jgi:deoxyribose-phosphate aldolase
MNPMKRIEVARMIDHTLLAPTATLADVRELVAEAERLGTYAVCVSPSMLPLDALGRPVAAVCGFPSGKHTTQVKAAEAEQAVRAGAAEIDMVIDVGAALGGHWSYLEDQLTCVRKACGRSTVLKVILETAALTDAQIIQACKLCEQADADFVKTSTGFHPAGGATVHAVELMAKTVGHHLGVKASGGIRDAATAQALIEAGATRLGLSATAAVLSGFPE